MNGESRISASGIDEQMNGESRGETHSMSIRAYAYMHTKKTRAKNGKNIGHHPKSEKTGTSAVFCYAE